MIVTSHAIPIDKYSGAGYFAGTSDGIVSLGTSKTPAIRKIYCFDAQTLQIVRMVWSFSNGHYLIPNLRPDKGYLIIARDHEKVYKKSPCWDWQTPVTTLSVDEQTALVETWQQV